MHNPWKLATLGLVALSVTVGTSTLTTAYLMRPPVVASEGTAEPVASPPPPPRPPFVRVTPAPKRYAAAPITPRIVPAAADTAAAPPTVAPTPVASSTASRDCITGGDRALRIIGGLAGAALGSGYGAYTMKKECGTVFGAEAASATATAPLQSAVPGAERIQIYEAR
jgi:hypothetical protein